MSTTEVKTDLAQDEERCPKCQGILERVEGTDVQHCDACGYTSGEVVEVSDVVVPEVHTAVEVVREPSVGEQALDRATSHMLTTPGAPGRDDFLALAATANMIHRSGGAPKAIKMDPFLAFHVAMIGRDLGISPSAAIQMIDVIGDPVKDPDNLQLSISPELMVAQVHRLGLGKVQVLSVDYTQGVAIALRPDGYLERDIDGKVVAIHGEIGRSVFTWEDAVIANLADERCLNGNHHWRKPGTTGRDYNDRCKCRTGWRTYPKRMLGWRAEGFACADWFPEASVGLYSAEELGAMVDEDGRPIDPTTVELPPGYETATIMDTDDPVIEPASAYDIACIKARVANLPEAARAVFLERWKEKVAEGRLGPVDHLTVRQHNIAKALVNGAEAEAKKDPTWKAAVLPDPPTGDEVAPAPATEAPSAPQEAQVPPEGESPPVTTPDPDPGVQSATEPPPEGDPGPVEQPTLGDQPQPEPQFTLEAMDNAIAAVSIMTPRALNAALRERGIKVDGVEENVRKQHLCKALATEATTAAREAASGA